MITKPDTSTPHEATTKIIQQHTSTPEIKITNPLPTHSHLYITIPRLIFAPFGRVVWLPGGLINNGAEVGCRVQRRLPPLGGR
jgi:hypothetical protein